MNLFAYYLINCNIHINPFFSIASSSIPLLSNIRYIHKWLTYTTEHQIGSICWLVGSFCWGKTSPVLADSPDLPFTVSESQARHACSSVMKCTSFIRRSPVRLRLEALRDTFHWLHCSKFVFADFVVLFSSFSHPAFLPHCGPCWPTATWGSPTNAESTVICRFLH